MCVRFVLGMDRKIVQTIIKIIENNLFYIKYENIIQPDLIRQSNGLLFKTVSTKVHFFPVKLGNITSILFNLLALQNK